MSKALRAEIAELKLALEESDRKCAAQLDEWNIAEQALSAANARIATLETADRENSELLEAAIEGQSYWQARAERFEAALRDVINPLAKLKREADAQGAQLSGMAYTIAHDLNFVQQIAAQAIADAQPTQGEGSHERD